MQGPNGQRPAGKAGGVTGNKYGVREYFPGKTLCGFCDGGGAGGGTAGE